MKTYFCQDSDYDVGTGKTLKEAYEDYQSKKDGSYGSTAEDVDSLAWYEAELIEVEAKIEKKAVPVQINKQAKKG